MESCSDGVRVATSAWTSIRPRHQQVSLRPQSLVNISLVPVKSLLLYHCCHHLVTHFTTTTIYYLTGTAAILLHQRSLLPSYRTYYYYHLTVHTATGAALLIFSPLPSCSTITTATILCHQLLLSCATY